MAPINSKKDMVVNIEDKYSDEVRKDQLKKIINEKIANAKSISAKLSKDRYLDPESLHKQYNL